MDPLHPEQENRTPETEIKALPIPNQWKLWRWRPKDRKSLLFGGGFLALAFVMIMTRVDVNQQREAQQAQLRKPNPGAPAITNPSPAQVQQWGQNLQAAEQQYQAEKAAEVARQAMLKGTAANNPMKPLTTTDLNAALANANATGSNGTSGGGGTGSQQDQLKQQQRDLAYKSQFADNFVHQEQIQPVSFQPAQSSSDKSSAGRGNGEDALPRTAVPPAAQSAQTAQSVQTPENHRKGLDFDPAKHQTYWLPEGTIIEAELMNRLDGEQPGPVLAQVTSNVYLEGSKLLLIPQGAKLIGSASKVNAFGQQRLAVAFHRTLVPGLHLYSIPMDKEVPGLSQVGETGLHDKVDNHYASIFGASLAVGAIGGLTQLGNGYSGFGYDPGVQFRNGISMSMAQSADRILDRFLNRMPTVVIREGTRVRVVLTDDWQVPAYEDMMQGDLP
jgi:type IV secretory pathway VirB10-like protein